MKRRNFLQAAGLAGAAGLLPSLQVQAAGKKPKTSVRMVFMSDIHVKPGAVPEKGMSTALQHIQQQKNIDFIMNGGDAIMDALDATKERTQTQFSLFQNILKKENSLPVHHCIGNHDVWGWFLKTKAGEEQDRLYGKVWVVEELQMPKRYYRFTQNKWHFIVLDSTQNNPAGGYIGKLDDEQFTWLENELKQIPLDEYVCLVSHIPILSICAGLFFDKNEPNGDLKIQRNLMHSDFLRIKKLLIQYPQVRTALSGHIHLQDELQYLGVHYYCNGAISGNWWSGAFQEFEPAYAIFEFYADGSCSREMQTYGFKV